jgi:basic membrane protein A
MGKRSVSKTITAAIIIAIIVIVGAGGYYYYSNITHPTKPVPKVSIIKIGLLLPGPTNDLSWNEAGYVSTINLAKELNASGQPTVVSTTSGVYTTSDITPPMQSYASSGYNLIIYVGYQGQVSADSLNASYPNTGFLIVNGYEHKGNVETVLPRSGQWGFIMGAEAALLAPRNGKVADIAGENVGLETWAAQGFKLGVEYVDQNFNKSVTPEVIFVGNFDDPAAAKAAAATAISSGANVLYCQGDGITEGVAAAAVEYNVPFLFTEYNATSEAPNNTYGGIMFTYTPVFKEALEQWVTNHSWPSTPYYMTFQDGGETFWMSSKVPANVTTVIHNIYNALTTYKIKVYQIAPNGSLVYSPVTPPYSSIVPSSQLTKIGLLLPGPTNDLSWNEAGYVSTINLAKELNASGQPTVVSTTSGVYTTSDITPPMQSYASSGYNLIIYVGYQGQVSADSLNASYPNTGFLIVNGYEHKGNVETVLPRSGQWGFIMGAEAALLAPRNGKVADIAGENVGLETWAAQGFKLGVEYVDQNFNKSVTPEVIFVGNFDDPAAAKAAAATAISSGANVLYCQGDGITEGVAAAAVEYNVPFLFTEYNATSEAPNNTYGGIMFTYTPVFKEALEQWVTNHSWPSTPYYMTFQDGGETFWMSSKVPANVTTVIHNIYNALTTYKIKVYQIAPNGSLVYSPVTPPYSSIS